MKAFGQFSRAINNLTSKGKNTSLQAQYAAYKKNVIIFVQSMKKEVLELIQKYEKNIRQLKNELKIAKEGKKQEFVRNSNQFKQTTSTNFISQKSRITSHQHHTNTISPLKSTNFIDLPLSTIYNKKINDESKQFNPELLAYDTMDEKNISRFEETVKRKKKYQQELLSSLESGQKNMSETTSRMLDILGKNNKKKKIQKEQIEKEQDNQSVSSQYNTSNKSLDQICQSLDTSLLSKRTRNSKQKQREKKEKQMQQRLKQMLQNQKMIKQRGIKNLLHKLRFNASSPGKVQQGINSKLFQKDSVKSKEKQTTSRDIKSKQNRIYINPVPVDIAKRSKITQKQRCSSPTSPQVRPQSILKKSGLNSQSLELQFLF